MECSDRSNRNGRQSIAGCFNEGFLQRPEVQEVRRSNISYQRPAALTQV
jgi:hypothetical protein